MQRAYIFILLVTSVFYSHAQDWTEPINVSNMGGLNLTPDFCIDNNGVIHCVWQHFYETNFSKIFYNKSYNDGTSWTTAEDISLNNEKRLSQPHIVCDLENNLHITFDYNIGNPYQTLVYYKMYDGVFWSEPFTISENMPEAHNNKLIIDNYNRVYCFWHRSLYNNGTTFYRYYENGNWSEIFIPYDNNGYLGFANCAIDTNNNLHWIGSHHYEGQTHYDDKPVYFYYENGLWSDFVEFGELYSWNGKDIDLDDLEMPHLVWREFTNDSLPPNDGTFYVYNNGYNWTVPELIVEDPRNQQIIFDNYNKPNIFDSEKLEDGTMLVHYYKAASNWQGYIIDDSDNNGSIKIDKRGNNIYLVYVKGVSGKENSSEIMFSKTDMITSTNNIFRPLYRCNIYPNPFKQNVKIEVKLNKEEFLLIRIYTMQGKLINTLIDENKSPGKYEITWNGKDNNGKGVSSGLYLVRLQSGRNILTRSVEYIK